MNARAIVRLCIRGISILLVVIAVLAVAAGIARQVPYQWGYFMDRPFFALRDELRWAVLLLLLAAALWLAQRPLSRLIAPRSGACPECGYDLRKLKGTRCPECGWELPPRPSSTPDH